MKTAVSFGALLTFLFVAFAGLAFGQMEPGVDKLNEECGQSKEIRDPLIDEAELEQFSVRRVEIVGGTYTRDREFRKRMGFVNEGDIFVRKNLEATVKRICQNVDDRPDKHEQY